MNVDAARWIAFDSECGPRSAIRLVRARLARSFESAASPRRSVFAPPTDTLTRPDARKWGPANQAFPNLLFGGSLQY